MYIGNARPSRLGVLVELSPNPKAGFSASIPYIAGAAVGLVGQSVIPGESTGAKVAKTVLLLGGLTSAGLALYQIAKPVGAPESKAGYDLKDLFVTSEPGWRLFGTPRIDLKITNKSDKAKDLVIRAGQYEDKISDQTREVELAPVSMALGPGETKAHEFFLSVPAFWTSARIVSFNILDAKTNELVATYDARFPARFEI